MATDVLRDFQDKLDEALEGLEIPLQRRKLSLTNLQWPSRNLADRNSGEGVKRAKKTVIELIRRRREVVL